MNTDKKLLLARTKDLFTLCDKHCEAKFSGFLDGAQAAVIEDDFSVPYGYNTMFFGGYEGAERRIFGVFPEWEEARSDEFPISVVRIDAPKFRTLTHRDYLGTLMSLGFERSKTGDILVDDNGAYAVLMSDIAEYAVRNITKIANIGVKIYKAEEFTIPKPNTMEKTCVSASVRLDAVTAAALNISRTVSEKLISGGSVKVNHRETADRSKQINEGDLISVKGYGRFILKETGQKTGKGRLHITVEKFL